MSDLAAASAALGIPEDLTQRSAEARATVAGASVEDILAAWSGGAPAPVGVEAAEPAAPAAAPVAEAPVQETETAPEIIIQSPEPPIAESVPAGPYEPPVLVGSRDNPVTVLAGALALFAMIVVIGLVGPASQAEEPGARSSDLAYTQVAVEGQEIYGSLGCSSCHTQMVRPVIADVGLGGVTLNDSDQVLGTRRFGPDLSDVGSRITDGQIEATVGGLGGHPSHSLSAEDMSRLVAYLSQSKTSGGS